MNECFAAMINNNGAPEVFRLLHTSLTLTLRAAFAHKSDKKAMNSQSSGGFCICQAQAAGLGVAMLMPGRTSGLPDVRFGSAKRSSVGSCLCAGSTVAMGLQLGCCCGALVLCEMKMKTSHAWHILGIRSSWLELKLANDGPLGCARMSLHARRDAGRSTMVHQGRHTELQAQSG